MGLDIYLLRKVFIGAGGGRHWLKLDGTVEIQKNGLPVPVELHRIWEITECVGYWRKFAPLHQWMLYNALAGQNDCQEHVISMDIIVKLKTDCEKILSGDENWISRAKEVFPWLHFEKADPEQLEEFLSEIRHTHQVLCDLPKDNPDDFYCYRASW